MLNQNTALNVAIQCQINELEQMLYVGDTEIEACAFGQLSSLLLLASSDSPTGRDKALQNIFNEYVKKKNAYKLRKLPHCEMVRRFLKDFLDEEKPVFMFKATVTEHLTKTVTIEAKSSDEALALLEQQYCDGQIELTSANFSKVEFSQPVRI